MQVEPDDALRVLAAALAPYLFDLLGLSKQSRLDDWLDVAAELPACRRTLYRACRSGELAGRRIKRRWLVRRADLNAWVESHETALPPEARPPVRSPAAPREVVTRVLSPAELHEREMDAMYAKIGGRRLNDAERAARGMPPYDVNQEYEEFQAKLGKEEERRTAKECADNDPAVATRRAAETRAADARKWSRTFKTPRMQCPRCGRTVFRGKCGTPEAHHCPHGYGTGCYDVDGNYERDEPRCPWCAKERAPSPQ